MNLKQVAELAGVSVSTVSRVLNGKTCVNENTRQVVLKTIRETNYRPNALAKSLKMGRTNTICLMVPSIANLMFPKLVRGLEDAARKNGFTVMLCNTDEDENLERAYIENMKLRMVDGFIICSLSSTASHIQSLRDDNYPVVLVNRFDEGDTSLFDTVSADNYQIGYIATHYLARTGHKTIAIAQGRDDLLLYRERMHGYMQALEDSGIPYREELVMREGSGNESFYGLAQSLLKRVPSTDAIFCTSDPKAFVVMHALHDMGIEIPEDVSVIGVDNVSLDSMMEPPLTTVTQHLYDMGVSAANSLIRQIEYKERYGLLPKPEKTVFTPNLIVRRSTN